MLMCFNSPIVCKQISLKKLHLDNWIGWLCLRTGGSAQVLPVEQRDEELMDINSSWPAHWIHIHVGDSNADLMSNTLGTRRYHVR